MKITLGQEFESRITEKVSDSLYTSTSEVIRDGLRLLFEKYVIKNQQLEIFYEEVVKGFEQLAAGESSQQRVMGIFEQASLSVNKHAESKNNNVNL